MEQETRHEKEVDCHWCGNSGSADDMYYYTGDDTDTMCQDCAKEQGQIEGGKN